MATSKPASPPFPFAGVTCLLMGGLLLISGGFRFGKFMIGFALAWAILAVGLKVKRK